VTRPINSWSISGRSKNDAVDDLSGKRVLRAGSDDLFVPVWMYLGLASREERKALIEI